MQLRTPVWTIALTLTGLLCVGVANAANPLFSGVTGIELRPADATHSPVITFQADFPFQYRMQRLNHNQVLLTIQNARLSDTLLSPQGLVALQSSDWLESARVRMPERSRLFTDNAQELILTGPGLGDRALQVAGVIPLPPLAEKGQHHTLAYTPKPVVVFPKASESSKKPETTLADKAPITMLNMETNEASVTKSLPPEPEMPVTPKRASVQTAKPGPQITAVMDAPTPLVKQGKPVVNMPSHAPEPAREQSLMEQPVTEAFLPQMPSGLPESDLANVASQSKNATEQAALPVPEPNYQVLMPVPRYYGGAPPIRAMTMDEHGRTVMVTPKNAPIEEVDVAQTNAQDADGYNALSHADAGEAQIQAVSRLMNTAVGHYRNSQWDEAAQVLQSALRLDSTNGDLYAAMAEIQLQQGKPGEAAQSYQQAVTLIQGKYEQRYAQVLVLAGQRAEAVQVLKQMLQVNPKQAQVAYMLGTIQETQGHAQEAVAYLQQAADLYPTSAELQYHLGLAYEMNGNARQAQNHYQKAIALDPNATDAAKALERSRQ